VIQGNGIPRFANYLQDHLVLQRAPQRAIVWGFGDASTVTTLRVNDQIYTTISRPQPSANGTLVTITLHDVLFGDVWICSGQSNMQLTVSLIYNATEEIANAGNYPKIRVFTASRKPSASPIEELINISLNWSVASPHSLGGPDWEYMSAVCWLYGRMIHQALDGRPIGLIATSFGGTFIELWMPPKALQDCNTTTLVLNILRFFF
jgi:sialate O-acetylesterase